MTRRSNETNPVWPVNIRPRPELAGCKFGVRFKRKKSEVFVSPAIYSLYESDPEKIIHTLRVVTFASENDKNNPLRHSTPFSSSAKGG